MLKWCMFEAPRRFVGSTSKNIYQVVPKDEAGSDHKSKPASVLHFENQVILFVNWLGLEPRTHTLKVYCSTN